MFAAGSSTIPVASKVSNLFISSSSSSSSNGKNSKVTLSNLPPASRICVKNLPYAAGEAVLIKLFSKFGPIVEVKLATHEETMRSKGYAFIQYTCQDDAVLALEHMDHSVVDGRVLFAEIARPSRSRFGAYPKTMGPPLHQKLDANVSSDHVVGDLQ